MKAITLHQPWATLIAIGEKRYETRSWPTNYRGLIAIHAGKSIPPYARALLDDSHFFAILRRRGVEDLDRLPRGAVVAIARLVNCYRIPNRPLAISETERMLGDWSPGRYAWSLMDIQAIEPVPIAGSQGLWEWNTDGWNGHVGR